MRLSTVDVVPPITCELVLVEKSPVGAEERGTLVSFPSIVADVICLVRRNLRMTFHFIASSFKKRYLLNYLTAGFNVGIHPRSIWHVTAMEVGWRHASE
jgi:hypothetical protein